MASKPTGYGTMQIGGQERPFQVGTNQADVFQRLRHVSLKEYGETFGLEALQQQLLTSGDIRDFNYSALVAGYENDGQRVDFTPANVGNWIDDAPMEASAEIMKPLTEMVGQIQRRAEQAMERAKNGPAPTLKLAKGPTKAKKA